MIFKTKFRLILAVFFFISTIVGFIVPFPPLVVVSFITAGLLSLVGHFKFGTIIHALRALQKTNIQAAEELLNHIRRPDWLSKQYQAYYYFIRAVIASHQQDIVAAESNSEQALALNKLGERESAILRYNITRAAYVNGNLDKAKNELVLLQQLQVEDLHLKKRIEEIAERLNA